MVDKCKYNLVCRCVGCDKECDTDPSYCEDCDKDPIQYCSIRDDKKRTEEKTESNLSEEEVEG